MVSFEEGLKIVLNAARYTGIEEVDFKQSVKRVLANDLRSDISMPPFDKSAMDGYACREADLSMPLEVIEVIQAGKSPQKTIQPGQCAQIMTGAIIPEGADTVIMVEQTQVNAEGRIEFTGKGSKSNICYLGEDVHEGDLVLEKGTLISPRHIPVLATIGAVRVPVAKSLKVAVIATGTELVEPAEKPGPSQIRNSNASQMMSQLYSMGIPANYYGIAPDDEQLTYEMLEQASDENDLVILSGGVSMGEFDFVPGVLMKLGFDIKFQKMAVQPGKPTTFGVRDDCFVFALPGNPVSSFVQLEILVKPFIYQCMGHDFHPPAWKLPAGKPFLRKKTDRMAWIPVTISQEGRVLPLEYHGSAHIFSLTKANALIYYQIGQALIEEGDLVDVRPI